MQVIGPHSPDRPTSEDIRAALDRVLQSDAFRTSPQLVAFLRFVVEAALAGHSDRIKGYTIAVEALGRSEDFDPQSDPIVRVEAARLRRALERYYAETGTAEPLVIELPRGSYVPVFRSRDEPAPRPRLIEVVRDRLSALQRGQMMLFGALAGVVSYALIDAAVLNQWPLAPENVTTATVGAEPAQRAAFTGRSGSGLPLVSVERAHATGAALAETNALEGLTVKLRDALARFDEIEVAADMPSARWTRGAVASAGASLRSSYSFATTSESDNDGTVSLTVRLNDARDGTVVWTRTFDGIRRDDTFAGLDDIVLRVVATVAQPYGVIYARERARLASGSLDRRYGCLLEAFEYWRGFDRARGPGVRQCLEQITALHPNFAEGFAILALMTLRDHYEPVKAGPDLINPALIAAQRAVDLKPQSARARQALMSALFARGQIDAALTEGEKMIALNPYDMTVLQAHGMRLALSGQVETGAALLREAAAHSPVRTPKLEFALFLCDYLLGEAAAPVARPRLHTSDDYPLILAARAVVAAKAGDRARARGALERLVALHPGWRDNPRRQLERYIPTPMIVDRLSRDLNDAGLGTPN